METWETLTMSRKEVPRGGLLKAALAGRISNTQGAPKGMSRPLVATPSGSSAYKRSRCFCGPTHLSDGYLLTLRVRCVIHVVAAGAEDEPVDDSADAPGEDGRHEAYDRSEPDSLR